MRGGGRGVARVHTPAFVCSFCCCDLDILRQSVYTEYIREVLPANGWLPMSYKK